MKGGNMAMQMIENWSIIFGVVIRVIPSEERVGYDRVEIRVEKTEPVQGYPDLVKPYLEEEEPPFLPVLMPEEIVINYQIIEGVILKCQVRRAGLNLIFVHREHITILHVD
jgi:hypothetical protein